MITHRIAMSPDDLRAGQRLISDAWNAERPNVPFTVVALEWLMTSTPVETDWSDRVHLWEDDGEVVGFAWFAPDGNADALVRADHRNGPIEEAIDAIHAEFAARDGQEPGRFSIDGLDTEHERLRRHGFAPTDLTLHQWYQRLTTTPPPPILPDGYHVRTLTGEDELPARVEVHRAAFAPSHLTLERYRRIVDREHYAFARDVVVEAPDGSFASFALTWFDPVGRVGEFEPVGTDPIHQRQGLALAALCHGLGLLHAAGAVDVIVYAASHEPGPMALYPAAGFTTLAIHRRWARSR